MKMKDRRTTITKKTIERRLYQDVKERCTLALIMGALGLVVLIGTVIALVNLYKAQNPTFYAIAVFAGCAMVCGMVLVVQEGFTLFKLVRRIKKGKYRILHDRLTVANEKMHSIGPTQRRHVVYKDEYIFESGMRYVRESKGYDEFGLLGVMQYSDEPIPFLIVVYDEHPDAPILLYNERVFYYQETE